MSDVLKVWGMRNTLSSKAALKFTSCSNRGICLADLNYSSLETIQPKSWGNIMAAMLNSTALLKSEKLYPWM